MIANNIVGSVCDEMVATDSLMRVGGFVHIAEGWICGRAIGMNTVCE
jgi:hypothetical protein